MEASVGLKADLLQLTQQFYAVAMSGSGWESALDPMVDLLRADHAMIIAGAPHGQSLAVAASAGMDQSDFARFLSPEAARWMAPFRSALQPGTAALGSQLVSFRRLESSQFYNEIVRPAGGFHSMGARNEQPALSCFVAACRARQAGDFETSDTVILQALLPHLTMALELHCKFRLAERGRQQFGHVLDRLDAGIILTDAKACPAFVNPYAERLTAAEDGVKLDHRGLAAATPEATRRLRAAVAATSAGTALESRHVHLERPSGGPPLLLTIMPIWQFDAAIARIGGPSVAIVIREPSNPVSVARLDMVEAFHLTKREKEVASLIAGGLKRVQIANKLGISEATVKSHLEHLFEKTGTHRQIDLIKLLVEHTSSVAR